MKALVDASALLLLVKHADAAKLADMAADLTTLDLASYEAGNGIWKQVRLLKLISEKDARATHEALVGLLSHTSIVRGEELDCTRAMDLAVKKGIAYYDACYIIAAESLKLPLATEDRKLAGSTTGHDVIGWKRMLGEE
jgi:predicted nucleic acid-binding protein